jgi:hypothetical protein
MRTIPTMQAGINPKVVLFQLDLILRSMLQIYTHKNKARQDDLPRFALRVVG